MADRFDRFLSEALAPPERGPDRAFVRLVQARVALEDRLSAERRAVLSGMFLKILALAAFAAGLVWLGRSPAVGGLAAESPAILLALLLAAFSFLVLLFSADRGGRSGLAMPLRAFSMT